jgi:hypothetical protein
MASVPDFFCEIIGICYKSTIEEFNKDQNIEDRRKLAEHAFPLLWKWKTPPGLNPDLSFDIGKFNDWYSKVLEITLATGHAQVANSHVGKVLFYVPKDASGLWMNNDIAKFINENENKTIRESFVSEFYNSRGVFNWSGGEEEKKLADKYTEYAKAVNKKGFLRLAASLRKLAKSYEEDSNREATEDPFDR